MKFDFNDYKILDTFLWQVKPEDLGLEGLEGDALREATPKIIAGSEGGLAYRLFPREGDQRLLEQCGRFSLATPCQREKLIDYIGELDAYIETAGDHARRYGFELVSVSAHSPPKIWAFSKDGSSYNAGIGSITIESTERFTNFLTMIKEGRIGLSDRYKEVVRLGEMLKE